MVTLDVQWFVTRGLGYMVWIVAGRVAGGLREFWRHPTQSTRMGVTRLRTTVRSQLLSGNVTIFAWFYYVALFGWGVYAVFFSAPITVVYPVMGTQIYRLWAWMHIFGTSCWAMGMSMTGALQYPGLYLRLGGHVSTGFVLITYEVAAIAGSYWGEGTYSVVLIVPYCIGCLLLAASESLRISLKRKELVHIKGCLPR